MLIKYEKLRKTILVVVVEDACHDNDLHIINIVFQYFKRGYTMQSPCGKHRNQTDCILKRGND